MRNETIINFTKEKLKELLDKCTVKQQMLFKQMYSYNNLDMSINNVVDNMDIDKLDWALSQVERTVEKNKKTFL